ncbi:MAG TPA: carboxypeptidase-like regulatory domain-containing protein [Flavisolibacter sp.]|jgi:hypothetical protein|nr:carboxypeptidase-like regulatory domain-containing protein [Flavisolibacter sp.]
MKLLYISCLFLLLGFVADSQKLIRGVVVDEANKLPLDKATVFINGTSSGTTTNEAGEFILRIPNGRHIIIGFSSGFDTYGKFINSGDTLNNVVISLKKKPSKSDSEVYQINEWQQWGEYFLANFLGSNENTKDCRIKNTRAIHFQVSKETGDVSATADVPLIIENKALGYTIIYKLESFHCNFKTLLINYTGYALFQPMSGNTAQLREWEKRRRMIYYGSIMHFMRSIYRNEIEEEGFEIRSLKKVFSLTAKPTLFDSAALDSTKTINDTNAVRTGGYRDIEDQIINPDNYKDVIGAPLSADSIAYAIDRTTAGLYFENFLLVLYKGVTETEQYKQVDMSSQLVLVNKRPLEIESDGSFYDYRDLMILGYWTWSQQIRWLLPYDYILTATE